jgi:hypothetical protein
MLKRSSRLTKKFFRALGRGLLEQVDISDLLGEGIGEIEASMEFWLFYAWQPFAYWSAAFCKSVTNSCSIRTLLMSPRDWVPFP